jgi:hypothetical protein
VHDIEDFEFNLIYVCLLIISIIKLFITKIRVMSHSCQTNELGAEQLQDFDTMYGRINLGLRRDSPMEGEGRRTLSPPDPRATTETSLHRNIIVKRGVDHDITASAMKDSLQKTSSSVALRNTLKPSATLAGDMVERAANSTRDM